MAHVERRIDFSDSEARFFCLGCGAAYAREVETCASCAAGKPTSRRRIADLMRQAVPDSDGEDPLPDSLWALTSEGRAGRLPVVLELLWKESIPFLLIDEDGQALEPHAEGAVDLLAPAVPLQEVMEKIARGEVPDALDSGDAEAPVPMAHTVKLISCADLYEANLVQARLDEAEIPFQISRMSQQFGFTVGRLAAVEIYVTESDLERARNTIAPVALSKEPAAGSRDDAQARLQRQYNIARWYLYPTGIGFLLTTPFAYAVHPLDAVVHLLIGAALVALAVWSHRRPRPAFLGAFLVASGACVWGMLTDRPILLVPGFICILALYFAYQASLKASAAERAEGSSSPG